MLIAYGYNGRMNEMRPISTTDAIPFEDWAHANEQKIRSLLPQLKTDEPLDRVFQSEFQGVFLRQLETTLELYCYDLETRSLSEIMSRIDVANPLHLQAPYSQATFLGAMFLNREPERIYLAGYGGGRLAMLFHHYFMHCKLDGSDIDPNMLDICRSFFGFVPDERCDFRTAIVLLA